MRRLCRPAETKTGGLLRVLLLRLGALPPEAGGAGVLREPPDRSLRRLQVLVRTWLLLFVVCAMLTALSFAQLDLPLTLHFWTAGRSLSSLSTPFGAGVILTLESSVALGLIVTRLVRGHISRIAEVLALACLTSICTYGINTEVLKELFGVP